MRQLSEFIKEVYKLLYKAGYYLSLVWFLRVSGYSCDAMR